jgi:hypothetical protein
VQRQNPRIADKFCDSNFSFWIWTANPSKIDGYLGVKSYLKLKMKKELVSKTM